MDIVSCWRSLLTALLLLVRKFGTLMRFTLARNLLVGAPPKVPLPWDDRMMMGSGLLWLMHCLAVPIIGLTWKCNLNIPVLIRDDE